MFDVNARLKELRITLDLSQTEFGKRFGVGLGVIKNFEYGITTPSELQIELICREFDINREWLVSGEGEMFREKSREEEIAEWAASLNDVDKKFQRQFVYALSRLDEAGWKVIEHFAQVLYDEQMAENEQKKKDEGN
ncbi:MAG: helix-turn-helix transcriptional regulator [Clostridia bacterium]|nr:helix-turn-helix transcriptional regulator [Clostridia bacterium]